MKNRGNSPVSEHVLRIAAHSVRTLARKAEGSSHLGLLEAAISMEKAVAAIVMTQAAQMNSWVHARKEQQSVVTTQQLIRWLDTYRAWLDAILLIQSALYRRMQVLFVGSSLTMIRDLEGSSHKQALKQALVANEASVCTLLESLFSFLSFYVTQIQPARQERQKADGVGSIMMILLLQGEEMLRLQTRKREVLELWEDWQAEPGDEQQRSKHSFRLALEKLRTQLDLHSPFSKSVTQKTKETLIRMKPYSVFKTPQVQASFHSARPVEEPWLNEGVTPGIKRRKRANRSTKKDEEENSE
ncbi:hypothetical protein [Brevibacillus invocatus]|uniref:hypothetical protein n=2 Tax=Brevibacillus invocatus TaxID=173959 RepID=UPI0011CEBCE9